MIRPAIRLPLVLIALMMLGGQGDSASAAFIPVYSTGVTNAGTLAAPGSVDIHYSQFDRDYNPAGSAFVETNIPSTWVGNTGTSQFIGLTPDASAAVPVAQYGFRTTFSLDNLNPTTVSITGQIAAEYTVYILVNRVFQMGPIINASGAFRTFTLNSGFRQGINELDFVVNNRTQGTPLGLQVNITSATADSVAVPEPGSALLLALGLATTARHVRNRRRRQA